MLNLSDINSLTLDIMGKHNGIERFPEEDNNSFSKRILVEELKESIEREKRFFELLKC